MAENQHRFVAIGECMIELLHQSENQLTMTFGGDTLNVAVYFARCSDLNLTKISYMTALGEDPYSQAMKKKWEGENIDLSSLRIIPKKLPGLYFIRTDSGGERSFYYYRSNSAAKEMFSGEKGKELVDSLEDFTTLYFSGITLAILDDAARERLLEGIKKARQKGVMVAFDDNYRPALWNNASEARKIIKNFSEWVSIALPSYDDASQLFGDKSWEVTAKRYRDYGVDEVIVKQGQQGCLISTQDIQIQIPALKVSSIVDTTAAGDSFNGAYLANRVKSLNTEESAKKAMEVAARVIQSKGAIISQDKMP